MKIHTIKTKPFTDQKCGTSGLRKPVKTYQQEHYLETFVQAFFNTLEHFNDPKSSMVIISDGRYFSEEAREKIIRIAEANGVDKVITTKDGLMVTPAGSHTIRKYKADFGIFLTASHNPAGVDGDFGIKLEHHTGGAKDETFTDQLYKETLKISEYKIAEINDVFHQIFIQEVDPFNDYIELLKTQFNFDKIKTLFDNGLTIFFDGMNASSGPVANKILCDIFGVPTSSLSRCKPLSDFGGIHPEPNPKYAKHLLELAYSKQSPDVIFASDGDGDRLLIAGRDIYTDPSDILAIFAKYHKLVPAFSKGIKGVARSRPTSSSLDKVAKDMGLDVYAVPTGWRFFANLLDSGKASICGEQSFGFCGDHIREKDGLWSMLFWLNIMAETGKTSKEIIVDFWKEYGRTFYLQTDFYFETTAEGDKFMTDILNAKIEGCKIEEFTYTDPVDGSVSSNQGVELFFDDRRIFYRMSGTASTGANLRIYIEKFEHNKDKIMADNFEYMKEYEQESFDIIKKIMQVS